MNLSAAKVTHSQVIQTQAYFTTRQMLCIYRLTSAIFILSVDYPSTFGDVAATSRHQPRIRLEKK